MNEKQDQDYLRRNLAHFDPHLAAAVVDSEPHPDLVVERSRSGHLNFGLSDETGNRPHAARTIRFFHSGYDPIREATRFTHGLERNTTVVVLGLGCGYHLGSLIDFASKVIVIEPDLRLLRSAAERVDLSLFSNPRLVPLIRVLPEDLADQLAFHYRPVIDGSITVIDLPGRVIHDRSLFSDYRRIIAATVESLRDDVATQARFGRRWLRNTCANIRSLTPHALPDLTGKRVIVTAAGPSLEQQIDAIRERAETETIIATDTSLPHLVARGVTPEIVVTIDCQLASYHHFLTAADPPRILVADLGSPPTVTQRATRVVPVLSAHPLHRLIGHLCPGLPFVDSGAGTVTYAAADLAVCAGARHVTLAGADFSYPEGKLYPRGSYIHRLFAARTTRHQPTESQHYSFLMNRPGVHRDPDLPTRYLQPSLLRYRMEVQRFIARSPIGFTQLPGAGLPLDTTVSSDRSNGRGSDAQSGAITPSHNWGNRWRTLPERLLDVFQELSIDLPSRPVAQYEYGRERTAELAAAALLPYAAYLRGCGFSGSAHDLMEQARKDTMSALAVGQDW